MSTQAESSNLSCARCHISEAHLGQSLQRCGGCRSVRYCSRECQRNAWPGHKATCRSISRGETPRATSTRTTMRMNMGSFLGQGISDAVAADREDDEDDSTIYHLHTSTPHLHDITISGPYHSLDAVAHQMLQNFGPQCRQGGETVLECAETGTLGSMEHITSPINNDQNRTKTCRIIKETNREVKALLPGTAYMVIQTDPDMEMIRSMGSRPASDVVPVHAMEVHGSFTEQAPAAARARQIAEDIVGRGRNRRIQDATGSGYGVDSFAVVEGRDVVAAVEVRRDDGQMGDGSLPFPGTHAQQSSA